jgi:23S rRNA pseudouridine1911/1915/1917 synthase
MTSTAESLDGDDQAITIDITPDEAGHRLDVVVAQRLARVSRSRVRQLIVGGHVTIDGQSARPATIVRSGERVCARLAELPATGPVAEEIPLEILFEDEWLIGLNKPAGMVVHPAKGHWRGTLASGLMHRFSQLSRLGGGQRPGIIHRLDRDTSGAIIVAKDDETHARMARQFERRSITKTYWALVSPPPSRDRDIIEQPIGPHPYQREKMAIRAGHPASRPATTFFEVVERCGSFAVIHANPKTGRTHQIRVHLAHAGSPIVADRLYSGRATLPALSSESEMPAPALLDRQALHALSLEFRHPHTDQPMVIRAPLARDLEQAWQAIRASRSSP